LGTFKDFIVKMLFFTEPEQKSDFFLKENAFDKWMNRNSETYGNKNIENANMENENTENVNDGENPSDIENEEVERHKNKIKQPKEIKKRKKDLDLKGSDKPGPNVYNNIEENLNYIKERYSSSINGDFIIREFDIIINKTPVRAFIIFFDGLVDRTTVNLNILQPLMLLSNLDIKSDEKDLVEYVKRHLLPQNQLIFTKKMQEVVDGVNFGGCGLFIDGVDIALVADVKGWEHRSVEKPTTELVLRGPQESFNEVLRSNTALIRKILKDENLICEDIIIGIRSKTPCSMLYIKDIVNNALVEEVRRRLKSIKIDYLMDSGELEQFIEDRPFLLTPQVSYTERPDMVAAALADGKVAIVVNGSPFVLLMPVTVPVLLHSNEDKYVRFPYANFFRFVRYLGITMSIFLPALYIAITNFHQEMIPTDLLLAIEASREKVPFPSLIEILLMEISFELLREAGVRIPGPIGPTLGIIGGLILGQAAVEANIVSPILIIIVAVTGLGSFAIPNFALAFSFRIIRFAYIILASLSGFLGITTGIFLHLVILTSSKSFGVPILAPIAPKTATKADDSLMKKPVWQQERRPDYLNAKDDIRQEKFTRKWEKK